MFAKALLTYILICPFLSSANEIQLLASAGLWGIPMISGTSQKNDNQQVYLGIGTSLDFQYLFGSERGYLLGISNNRIKFGYSQAGNTKGGFFGTDNLICTKVGYWWQLETPKIDSTQNLEKNLTSNIKKQVQFSIDYGNGIISLSEGGQPSQDELIQYLSLNIKLVTSFDIKLGSTTLLWFLGAGLFERFYDFSYGGVNIKSSGSTGPGKFTHFMGGIGIGF
jgi:hypothetical protein